MSRVAACRLRELHDVPNAGLLVLRIVAGVTFVMHGLDKLGGLSAAEQLFTSLDIPAPGVTAPFVAVTETVGGVLLLGGASLGIGLAGPGPDGLGSAMRAPP